MSEILVVQNLMIVSPQYPISIQNKRCALFVGVTEIIGLNLKNSTLSDEFDTTVFASSKCIKCEQDQRSAYYVPLLAKVNYYSVFPICPMHLASHCDYLRHPLLS